MASVKDVSSGRTHRNSSDLVGLRFTVAGLAAAVVALLVVLTLLGSRLAGQSNVAPAGQTSPSRDAAIVSYRAMVDSDVAGIRYQFQKRNSCATRAVCTDILIKSRAATVNLVNDVSSKPAPSSIRPAVLDIQSTGSQFITQIDAAIQAIESLQTDFRVAVYGPEIGALDLALATMSCWPVTPVPTGGVEGYGCTAGHPE